LALTFADIGGKSMPVTKIMDVKINYEDEGEGYPILFIHGFTRCLQDWDEQVPILTDKYRVVRYDCRGHGGSESPDDPSQYSQEILVDEALGLIDNLGLNKTNVCGLSMGGNVALNLAINHPDRVNGAIIVSTGSGSEPDDGFIDAFHNLAGILDKGDLETFTGALMASPLVSTLIKLRPEYTELMKEGLMSSNPKGLAHTIRGVLLKRNSILDLEDKLKNLDVPSLILAGESDEPCLRPADFMKQHIPNSRLIIMPETGHIVNLERPDDFNREMISFLNEVTG
jgi:pimeloyl-ACP methyl ester carboxylesterase